MRIRGAKFFFILTALTAISPFAAAQNLPATVADTLDGKKVDFPAALLGKVSVCVFGFGRESSDSLTIWLENLSADNVDAWSVVNIESSRAATRTVVRMTMKKGIPPMLLSRSLVIAKDANRWKELLEVKKDTLPVVVLFDATGRIAWKRQGTFSGAIGDELKAQIAALSAR